MFVINSVFKKCSASDFIPLEIKISASVRMHHGPAFIFLAGNTVTQDPLAEACSEGAALLTATRGLGLRSSRAKERAHPGVGLNTAVLPAWLSGRQLSPDAEIRSSGPHLGPQVQLSTLDTTQPQEALFVSQYYNLHMCYNSFPADVQGRVLRKLCLPQHTNEAYSSLDSLLWLRQQMWSTNPHSPSASTECASCVPSTVPGVGVFLVCVLREITSSQSKEIYFWVHSMVMLPLPNLGSPGPQPHGYIILLYFKRSVRERLRK